MENEKQDGLKYRDGREFTGKPSFTEKGKPFVLRQERCGRCGGAGGSDKWAHTGWTCYECGGTGKGSIVEDKLYTQPQIDKMNAAQTKRDAKKAAEREAAEAARKANRDARRESFVAANAELFAKAKTLGEQFIDEMIAQCIERVSLSERQIELINNKLTEAVRRSVISYVGEVGERRDFVCTLVTFRAFDSQFGRTYLHIMRDENSNTIKYMGSNILGGVTWDEDNYPVVDSTEILKFKATVKSHEEYNGEKQTVVSRPMPADVLAEQLKEQEKNNA
ncbi:MAG: hypothetical protein ACHQU0_03500 [Candidatus Paceibacteria bacterium]